MCVEFDLKTPRDVSGLCSHLQDEGVAAGGLIRVDQADYVGVLEPLEQVEFLSHPVPPHQLLVHLFDRHRTFGAALVTTLDHRETTPGEEREDGHSEIHIIHTSERKHCHMFSYMKVSLLPAQFNHLSVVRLKVVLPAHSDPVSGHC